MDTDILVDEKIEDGVALIGRLMRRNFDVSVAFWAKLTDESSWQLFIASPSFDPKTQNLSLRIVYTALDEIPQCSITPMDVSIISNTAALARDAIAMRDRNPSRETKRYHGKRLGTTATAELVIYPRRSPMKIRHLPDGQWQVLITESDNVWLTCDSAEEARAIAAAPVLEYEALDGIKAGEQFAAELEKTAGALAKYRMSFGYRYFTNLAEQASK